MPQIDFRLGIPTGVAIIAIVAAAVVAIAFYRTTLPPVSRGKRILLTTLRGLALSLIVLLLCEPLIRLLYTRSVPPALTVLVDDSRSMSIVDGAGKRSDVERSLLQSSTLASLSDRATVRILPFGTTMLLRDGIAADSLSFAQDGTDIAAALSAVHQSDRILHSRAVLLLTDGIITLGQNPLPSLSSFPFPVTTVAIGDSSEQRDIVLQRVASNSVVYTGTPTPVQVMLHASGYTTERITVSLADGTTPAGRATLTLEPGSRDFAVPFSWTPAADGLHTLTATVSALPGELTTHNNRRSLSVRVRKSKLRILIIAGEPSHDLAFFRATADEDSNIVISTLTQTRTGGFYEGGMTQAVLDSADCIVLMSIPTLTTPVSTMDGVVAAINRRQIPLLWIGGRNVDVQRSSRLGAILPFTAAKASPAEQEISIEPLSADQYTPLLAPNDPGDPSPWQQLPPIFSTRTVFTPKPGTTVLATARIRTVTTPTPALVIRSRPQRTLALLGYGIWRWRLLAQRSPAAADFFSRFVSNTLHWLTAPDDTAPVVVKPLAALYGQGEPLAFMAQVQDVQQRPIEDAEVRVVVRQRNQATEGVLSSVGNGLYEGTLQGVSEEGVLTYHASAGKGGRVLGADSGTVRVGGTHVEFLTTQTNTPLLRAIAARTGGASLSPDQFSRLPDELSRQGFFTPRTMRDGIEIQARSWPYLAGAIMLLLAAEWIIRKRSGML